VARAAEVAVRAVAVKAVAVKVEAAAIGNRQTLVLG
jgi:hypothetical protein